ncbi:MAG: cell division protein [Hydrogenophilales bacterium CG03_land_8_20_14_0_80_62_28]|nr:penicillin-binding protein 2 [Betaproteobacteria bacterium]OIO77333.1 MAG: cell division protein [Hydrogenophilaceae bacterium CG1_02_62_390]PIV21896.1 MAG: cell division protein [Hydrogenophilales bacterium CG03_land_8_20_14_0_80_62_28]PIW38948.1 MAG: cell division protein [Hydrogenophilales bacterium CG15_BIG_FIL_POST_REV_8_21_14_020_62_31]PIW72980.1 MAG: cell division protein [Hydrogenophilales bacterium CG12_big_fil_rev_8_21_14_0_65_61_21]PIX02553.1 MAG: cell division protein [Hydrogeno
MSRARNPILQLDLQCWRKRLLMALVFGGFTVLTARAAYLQGWRNDFLNQQGDMRVQRVVEMPAHRGMITDRRGEPLAISTPVESIWLNPREADATPSQIQALASKLDWDPDSLARLFANKGKAFVYLKRQLPPEVADAVQAMAIKGIHTTPEYRRYYPAGEVIGQVLGVTGADDNGLEGIEYAYQSWLGGEPGAKRVVKDRLGNTIEDLELVRSPKPGRDLTLSLNLQLQYLAYRELSAAVAANKARAGALVALDTRTGEILALANVPTFNPNNRATMTPERDRNRAVADTYEPGSTIKPFLVSAALEAGAVTPETRIDTDPGWLQIGEKRIHDVHSKGLLSVAEVIQVSSNVGAAKIALAMKSEDYWKVLSHAGFGAAPGSGFPGEAGGKLRPHETWRPIEKATMAFGMGMSVSLLQLARGYCAFADDGVLPRITILKRDAPPVGVRVLSAKTARAMRDMLESVTQPNGTAPQARITGYRVGGKTGTAHKAVAGGYSANKYIASFVGMAPMSDPRVVVAVMIDEPTGKEYYGGQIAAPVFAKVMADSLRFMAIPPDRPLEIVPTASGSAEEPT